LLAVELHLKLDSYYSYNRKTYLIEVVFTFVLDLVRLLKLLKTGFKSSIFLEHEQMFSPSAYLGKQMPFEHGKTRYIHSKK